MGEGFAYHCWYRRNWPRLSALFPNCMRDASFDDWRMMQRLSVNGGPQL